MSIEVCRYVVIATGKGYAPSIANIRNSGVLFSRVVEQGMEIPELGGIVVLARPSKCFIGVHTSIKFVRHIQYSVESLQHNYLIRLSSDGFTDIYVYPKRMWDTIERSILEPFRSGRKMYRQGVILYGPPGTGKTSLAHIIADINSVPVTEINIVETLSMWHGETEKRLYRQLLEAERSEPSLALADDAEWLLRSRVYGGVSTSNVDIIYSNLVRIILTTVERWHKQNRQILFVATTNIPPEYLDKALMRSGRLGEPVYVPLPDFEAVFEFLRMNGVDDKDAERWAAKAVNIGLSMADIKNKVLPELLAGREPDVSPQREEGYRRYMVNIPSKCYDIVMNVFNAIEEKMNICSSAKARLERDVQTLIWIDSYYPIALAFANAYFTYVCKMPTVTLLDYRRIDTAAEAAASLRGVLILPSSLPKEVVSIAKDSAPIIVFVGNDYPPLTYGEIPLEIHITESRFPSVSGSSKITSADILRAIAVVVLSFYGIEFTDDNIKGLPVYRDMKSVLFALARAGGYGSKIGDLIA